MEIKSNFSLKHLNTFKVDCIADFFAEVNSLSEVRSLFESKIFKEHEIFILGGGSNVLFTKNFNGLIIHPNFMGIEIMKEDESQVFLKVGAGEIWEDLVGFTVRRGWSGIENLAAIPGNVGAAPVQNIGAYGVELKDVFESLTAVDLRDGSFKVFQKEECNFSYRNSIFKSEFKNRYLITSVNLRLSKKAKQNVSYEALELHLKNKRIEPSLKNVYEAIKEIRASKLPDPKELGNVGSFFKNPLLGASQFTQLKVKFPEIKSFPQANGLVKLAAAWLIESCGWKGKIIGQVGVYENQALVLVNYGCEEGSQIFDLAKRIIKSVKEKFEITLEPEVNIL